MSLNDVYNSIIFYDLSAGNTWMFAQEYGSDLTVTNFSTTHQAKILSDIGWLYSGSTSLKAF